MKRSEANALKRIKITSKPKLNRKTFFQYYNVFETFLLTLKKKNPKLKSKPTEI